MAWYWWVLADLLCGFATCLFASSLEDKEIEGSENLAIFAFIFWPLALVACLITAAWKLGQWARKF